MKTVNFFKPDSQERQVEQVAWRTRHLYARLLDFGEMGPKVTEWSQEQGKISVSFPNHSAVSIQQALKQDGILCPIEQECLVFYLSEKITFEDLDFVWGVLFQILS